MVKTAQHASETRRPPAHQRRPGSQFAGGDGASNWFGSAVSFRVRRLEPLLSWGMAACTLWVSIVFNMGGTSQWWIILLAACVGGWSQMFPARHQSMLLLRGMLLDVGAFLLHMAQDSGGPTGAYFFWPVLITGFYTMLMSTGWAAVLALFSLLEFCVSSWLAPDSTSVRQFLAFFGILTTTAALAGAFARSLRHSDEQAESGLRDERTMLYNESGFFVHGSVLLGECRKAARPFSMVLLNGKDLRDIPELLGRKVANELFSKAVQAIAAIPGDGIAARVDSVEFALLLPGMTAERAAALVKQRLGNPPQLEIKVEARSIVIVLDMVVAQAKDRDETIEELYDQLHVLWSEKLAAQQVSPKPSVLLQDDDRFHADLPLASSTVPMRLSSTPERKGAR